jgi:hypothetical protein
MIIVNFDFEPLGLGGQDQIRIFFLLCCWDLLLLLVSNRVILLLLLLFFIWWKIRVQFFIGQLLIWYLDYVSSGLRTLLRFPVDILLATLFRHILLIIFIIQLLGRRCLQSLLVVVIWVDTEIQSDRGTATCAGLHGRLLFTAPAESLVEGPLLEANTLPGVILNLVIELCGIFWKWYLNRT